MDARKTNRAGCCAQPGEGKLPGCAPLANPYVPFQPTDPAKYEAKRGLVRGTLFPGLDLPFMGMANEHEKPDTPLHELQALGFAIQELALYLDTHWDDREALELYHAYQELFKQGAAVLEEYFGPLNHHSPQDGTRYLWLDGPWPWEYPHKND